MCCREGMSLEIEMSEMVYEQKFKKAAIVLFQANFQEAIKYSENSIKCKNLILLLQLEFLHFSKVQRQ